VHLYRRIGAAVAGLMAIVLFAGTAPAQPAVDTATALSERAIGSPDAPVTVTEYFSLTCPHCASFHNETFPALKEKYIDTGKVRFVYRDFPLDRVALPAAMMARCVDEKRYPGVIAVLFKTQNSWATARDPIGELGKIAALAGLGKEAFESCLQSEELANGVLTSRQEGSAAGVNSTPAFMVNGKIYAGVHSIEEFSEVLDPLLK